MSAALDLLSECSAAGVKLFLDNGRLRYRAQPGAYTEDLRQRVAVHRDAVIAALEGRSVTLDLTREDHGLEALPESAKARPGGFVGFDGSPPDGFSKSSDASSYDGESSSNDSVSEDSGDRFMGISGAAEDILPGDGTPQNGSS